MVVVVMVARMNDPPNDNTQATTNLFELHFIYPTKMPKTIKLMNQAHFLVTKKMKFEQDGQNETQHAVCIYIIYL